MGAAAHPGNVTISAPTPRNWRTWPAGILAAAAGATPIVAVLAPLGLIVVLSIAAVAVGVLRLAAERTLPLPRTLLLVFVPFALWSTASIFWAVDAGLAVRLLHSVLLVALGGMILIDTARSLGNAERARVERWLAVGFVAALLLLIGLAVIHVVSGADLLQIAGFSRTVEWFSHNRGATVFSLLAWPASVAVHHRYGLPAMLALLIVTFAVLLGYDSMAASVALATGSVIALLSVRHARLMSRLLTVGIIIVTLVAPLLLGYASLSELADRQRATSVYHRLVIWDFAAKKIAERPLVGWGFNSSRVLPGADTQVVQARSGNALPVMPLHPHNAILQLWIELGLPGAILGAALAILAIRGILARAEDVLWRAAALGLIAASLLIAFLSYGLWQRWWMSTLWLSAALMVATARQRSDDQPEKP